MNLNTLAHRVASKTVTNPDEYGINPAFIMLLMELFKVLLPMLEDCNKTPKQAVAITKDPTRIELWLVKILTRKKLGRRTYREVGKEVVAATFKVGRELTPEEVADLYDEAQV